MEIYKIVILCILFVGVSFVVIKGTIQEIKLDRIRKEQIANLEKQVENMEKMLKLRNET